MNLFSFLPRECFFFFSESKAQTSFFQKKFFSGYCFYFNMDFYSKFCILHPSIRMLTFFIVVYCVKLSENKNYTFQKNDYFSQKKIKIDKRTNWQLAQF